MICEQCKRLVGNHKLKDGICIDQRLCRTPINTGKKEEEKRPMNMLALFKPDDRPEQHF